MSETSNFLINQPTLNNGRRKNTIGFGMKKGTISTHRVYEKKIRIVHDFHQWT